MISDMSGVFVWLGCKNAKPLLKWGDSGGGEVEGGWINGVGYELDVDPQSCKNIEMNFCCWWLTKSEVYFR